MFLDVCPSSTSKPQEKQTFQFAYCLMILEYIGATLRDTFCCVKGTTPPPRPPPMGGSPPWPPCPMKFAKGVVCLLSASTSSPPSADLQSCRLERSKIRDVELHGWWGWCLRLIHCIARCCKCRKLLLHCLLIRRKLVDCCSDQCTHLCCRTCRQLILCRQGSHLCDDRLYVIIVIV